MPLFAFDMSNNHLGRLDHGLRIIREVREASRGFDFHFAFKFQYRHLDTFIHPDYQGRSDIKYVTGGASKAPFREHLDYIDRQITMVGTGGLLTMLTESGSGTLAGSAHRDTFLQIARGDAVALSEVMQREIDLPMLAQAFPGWPPLAYFEFAPSISDQASRVVQDAAQLAAAGYMVDPAEISEKSGYRLAPMAPAGPASAGGMAGTGVGSGG